MHDERLPQCLMHDISASEAWFRDVLLPNKHEGDLWAWSCQAQRGVEDRKEKGYRRTGKEVGPEVQARRGM